MGSSAFKEAQKATKEVLSAVLGGVKQPDGSRDSSPEGLRLYLDEKVFPMSKDAKLEGSDPKYSKLEPVSSSKPDKANPDGVGDNGKELPY